MLVEKYHPSYFQTIAARVECHALRGVLCSHQERHWELDPVLVESVELEVNRRVALGDHYWTD